MTGQHLNTDSIPSPDLRIVSVVIPAFNSAQTLRLSLPSILAQDRALIADITVVDSSDDGMMDDLVRDFEPRGIRFVNSGVRVMPAIQRNIGARESSGKLLLFLDSDVILEDGYISKIVSFFLDGHLAGFGSVTLPEFQSGKAVAAAQYYLQLNEYLPGGKKRTKPFVLGCSNFVDRSVFGRAGGYPEIRAAEDVLYGLKLAAISPIWFLPEASVAHVFREDWRGYLKNQKLLGKYVARYRKRKSSSPLFSGYLPVLLFPFFMLFKFCRIVPRIAIAGPKHLLRFASSLPAFVPGLVSWTAGFVGEAMRRENGNT